MQVRYTKHQVPRSARADAETFDRLILLKNVSILRATYQIKLLAYRALETEKKLVIVIPQHSKMDRTLRDLIKELPKVIRVERIV